MIPVYLKKNKNLIKNSTESAAADELGDKTTIKTAVDYIEFEKHSDSWEFGIAFDMDQMVYYDCGHKIMEQIIKDPKVSKFESLIMISLANDSPVICVEIEDVK